jgi:hypothetical protein
MCVATNFLDESCFRQQISAQPLRSIIERTRFTQLHLQSVLTCPSCGLQREEVTPSDACQFYYECTGRGLSADSRAAQLLPVD